MLIIRGMHKLLACSLFLAACATLASPAAAQAPSGDAVFQRECASCHAAGANTGAPTREALRQFTPEAILNALTNGKMQVQGARLTEPERRAVSEFLSGRSITAAVAAAAVGRCTTSPPLTNPANG